LQAEVSAGVSVLANVLFCALAVHILSFFNAAKLPLSFLRLVGNGGGMVSKGLRAFYLSSYSKIWSGLLHPENH